MTVEHELHQQVGHALRRAAGLPPLEDPINDILRPDELHLPWLGYFVGLICNEQLPTPGLVKDPSKVAQELGTIRNKLRELQRLIVRLDEPTSFALQWAGSTENKAYTKAQETVDNPEDLPPKIYTTDYVPLDEYQEWNMKIVLGTFARLEAAAAEVEQKLTADAARKVANKLPDDKRDYARNLNKPNVAVLVAEYIQGVTGKVPTLWKSDQPSGPFAKALDEIFRLLHLSHAIDRAGEQAIEAIKNSPRKFVTNEWFIRQSIPEEEFRKAARAAGLDWAPDDPESP